MGSSVQLTGAGVAANRAANTKDIPAPFSLAPEKYNAFLDQLDRSLVYIVHLDTLPRAFKRKIFIVPVILNVAIAVGILWRAYKAYPLYVDMVFLVLGYETNAKVDATGRSRLQMAWIVARRALTMLLDFVLVRFISWWPLTFFLQAPANPATWRWHVGFQDTEIVVRQSRDWGQKDLLAGLAQGAESPFFKTRILPAIDEKFMRDKTGYLMIRPDWDLEFRAMIKATELVTHKSMDFQDFQKAVLAYSDVHGWLYWAVHELDQGSEEEARKKIVEFKERLTAMGKESLFFRWVELIQFETSQPGGFTAERQEAAVQKAKTLFEQHHVDFEEFVKSIGGIDTFPGMAAGAS